MEVLSLSFIWKKWISNAFNGLLGVAIFMSLGCQKPEVGEGPLLREDTNLFAKANRPGDRIFNQPQSGDWHRAIPQIFTGEARGQLLPSSGVFVARNAILTVQHTLTSKFTRRRIVISRNIVSAYRSQFRDVELVLNESSILKVVTPREGNFIDYPDQDVALIVLKANSLPSRVRVIDLPQVHDRPTGKLFMLGWGEHGRGRVDGWLRKFELNLNEIGFVSPVMGGKEQRLITLSDQVGRGFCGGDSGGPLISEENGRWVVWGIQSYYEYEGNRDDCLDAKEFIFVDVRKHVGWIKNELGLSP